MQIIECENCHGYFELPEDSFERLNRVLKAGSGSIYLKCPYCNGTTALNRFTDLYTDVGLLKRTENPEVNIQYGLLPQQFLSIMNNINYIRLKNCSRMSILMVIVMHKYGNYKDSLIL